MNANISTTARRRAFVIAPLLTTAFCLLATVPAQATFQFWTIDQVYSNASGTVQFVELSDTVGGDTNVGGQTLTSDAQTFTFPADLPDSTPTAGQHMLLATPGYFALAGVTPADFMLPSHFLNVVGDTVTYAGGLDSITYSDFQLPIDNVHSLIRSSSDSPLTPGVNSPTNLAGQVGQIPPWENQNNRFDVDGSGKVVAKDVGNLINDLLANGAHSLAPPTSAHSPPPFLDVNGDNAANASDVNSVITFLLNNPRPADVAMGEITSQALSMTAISTSAMSTTMASPIALSAPEPSGNALALGGAGMLGFYGLRHQRRRRGLGQRQAAAALNWARRQDSVS